MFKQSNFENEIYKDMEKTLIKNQGENINGFDKIAKVTDLLNTAASIFESAEMYSEAEEIVKVIQNLAKDLK